ncbi:hypothetical protein [Lysobacter sp. cf310]|uniref:hypothetical protein n=1 Tax=Lysobacter sp. cf310 TaxID=1761790 RepID=UPI0008E44A52|nr:hypothetical protein [Lysobacter sp. cf310]SFK39127.1 hypothetical protein SAMN04487938_0605 [Lysobacter sp. cf310]
MPDASSRHGPPPPPQDWAGAFAALPAETPPADGWSRLSAALDARGGATAAPRVPRRTRRHWPRWAVAAALVGLAVALPIMRKGEAERPVQDAARMAATTTPAAATASAPRTHAPVATAPEQRDLPAATTAPAGTAIVGADPIRNEAAPPRKLASAHRPRGKAARRDTAPAPVTALATTDAAAVADAALATHADDAAAIARWQSESAQLEALVALARDERVGSAGVTLMSADLDSQIGVIDAALRQDALPLAQRASLWEQRVQTLRDLAGVESTQRWLAVHGERYDDALVRVD